LEENHAPQGFVQKRDGAKEDYRRLSPSSIGNRQKQAATGHGVKREVDAYAFRQDEGIMPKGRGSSQEKEEKEGRQCLTQQCQLNNLYEHNGRKEKSPRTTTGDRNSE